MNHLSVVVDGSRPPGLYRWRSRAHPASVARALAPTGITCHVVDGGRLSDADSLFDACAVALRFPVWFAGTWEALADCLEDRSWLPGRVHVLIWEHYGILARRDAGAWETAREVFGVQATASAKDGPPLYVLLRGDGPTEDLPVL